jgi:hypothetical protein
VKIHYLESSLLFGKRRKEELFIKIRLLVYDAFIALSRPDFNKADVFAFLSLSISFKALMLLIPLALSS